MSEPESPIDNADDIAEPRQKRGPVFNMPAIVIAIIGACVSIHIIRVYVLSPDQDFALLVRAAFIPVRYSRQYDLEIWAFTSPLTYAFLHGGFAHLILNMLWLAAFGSPLANRLGNMCFLAFFAVTSLAAVALHYVLHSTDAAPLVGASGAISGMMVAVARFTFQVDNWQGRPAFSAALLPICDVFRSRTAMTFLGAWMVINLVTGLVGFAPGVDNQIAWEAHIGGFLMGFLGIRFFDRKSEYA